MGPDTARLPRVEDHRYEERAVTDALDVDRPNLARVANYLIGGAANFAADRTAVAGMLAADPESGRRVHAARTFIARAVRAAAARGHDQFLDLGSGIPSVGGVHSLVGAARVAYVDIDPVAVAVAREALEGIGLDDRVGVTRADLLDVEAVLTAPRVAGLLDLRRPVTVVCSSVVQWLTSTDDGEIADAFTRYATALAPGSLLVLSAPYPDTGPLPDHQVVGQIQHALGPIRIRTRAEVAALVTGWDVLAPGIVDVADWPTPSGAASSGFSGVMCASRS